MMQESLSTAIKADILIFKAHHIFNATKKAGVNPKLMGLHRLFVYKVFLWAISTITALAEAASTLVDMLSENVMFFLLLLKN